MNPKTTALITGASSGIGYELAGVFAAHGHDLVLVSRRQPELQKRAQDLTAKHGTVVHTIPLDLSICGSSTELFSQLTQSGIQIDYLVNNAGFAVHGPFDQSHIDRHLQLLRLNIETLTHLTHLVLPGMRQRSHGRILNIASIASLMPGPWMSTYFASKAYVLSFSRALSSELRGTGITVTALVVGPTATNFAPASGTQNTKAFRGSVMNPAHVAKIGYTAMMRGKPIAPAGWRNRLRMIPAKFVPTSVLTYFAGKYHEVR
ncbi:MAG TPA: SDR family oxidoreductase [Tepidisphaeraceae bacterium]|nr:SDR family oxidoreductase [Tepidisphaeraceae bacterium]